MSSPLSFLVVEDDELDTEAFRRALEKSGMEAGVQVAAEGGEALERLREGARSDESHDRIVFLDLNMPGMNGHEFLAELRADPDLRKTIVFVLTSSDHARDVRMAYDRNVAGYFLKSELRVLVEAVSVYVQGVQFPR